MYVESTLYCVDNCPAINQPICARSYWNPSIQQTYANRCKLDIYNCNFPLNRKFIKFKISNLNKKNIFLQICIVSSRILYCKQCGLSNYGSSCLWYSLFYSLCACVCLSFRKCFRCSTILQRM